MVYKEKTMSNRYGPRIVTDGLSCYLDAADLNSYPGSGSTWYDLSGNDRHYAIDTANTTYNSDGYFDVGYKDTGFNFTGPASNTWDFGTDIQHTIFCLMDITGHTPSTFFSWGATPNTGTDGRAIFTHWPYGSLLIYDTGGCCSSSQRLYNNTDANALRVDGFYMGTWRLRTSTTPRKQFFKNGSSLINSGTSTTTTVTWDLTNNAGIALKWIGKIANFIVYNRALTDAEILQNHNALKGRFGL